MRLPSTTRSPAVAGAFYPAVPQRLAEDVDRMLEGAEARPQGRLRALIVPHAGYVYSGPIAASAYALLKDGPRPRRVLLLGPAHTVPLAGMALPDAGAMATPLGPVPLDEDGAQVLAEQRGVGWSELAHRREHSLEVQLPFLQQVLGDFKVVPVVVGRATPDDVALVIDSLADRDTLVVVSSDLSHYLPWATARQLDAQTAQQILELDAESLDADQACGASPVRGLLVWARQHGLRARLLDLRNSGDTAGDKDRVVGYGAFAFEEA